MSQTDLKYTLIQHEINRRASEQNKPLMWWKLGLLMGVAFLVVAMGVLVIAGWDYSVGSVSLTKQRGLDSQGGKITLERTLAHSPSFTDYSPWVINENDRTYHWKMDDRRTYR